MLIYSHRGESKYAPENTMSAFFLADLLNSDGIECDIRKTKDNILVLIHDKTIDRTSNKIGKVEEYTLNDLKEFDFGNKEYKGETIVTLTDFLNYFSNKNIKIFLEAKESGYEELLWKTISKYNINNITIISFKYDILKKLRDISKIIKLSWLVYDINKIVINDALKIHLNEIMCISIALNKEKVELIKKNNILACAWGIKNKEELKRMEKIGVDKIVYDSFYDAKKVLKNE